MTPSPLTIESAPAPRKIAYRTVALCLALLIEALLLILLLTFSWQKRPGREHGRDTMVTFTAEEVADKQPEPDTAKPQQKPTPRRPETPQPTPPVPEQPSPQPLTPVPLPKALQVPATPAEPAPPAQPRRVYGPPDTGAPRSSFADSERVGTAPNGEPLFAAEWYTRPAQKMLRDYLSTARGPGWGLIACRTASEWRVEDCVGLGEYPQGSQIMRAALAMAWEFKVRPPRLGGKYLVGGWVQIRIIEENGKLRYSS